MPKTAIIPRLFILAKKHREWSASLGRADETASGIACREACEKKVYKNCWFSGEMLLYVLVKTCMEVTCDYNMISLLTNYRCVVECPLGVLGLRDRVQTMWINFSFYVNRVISSWSHVFQVAPLLTRCSTYHRQQLFQLCLDVMNSL